MRKQTPAERDASSSTYGYARYPLTDEERRIIQQKIKLFEKLLGDARKR